MQEQQRYLNFFVISMMVFLIWTTFVAPRLNPPKPKAPPPAAKKEGTDEPVKADKGEVKGDKPEVAKPKVNPGKLHEYPARDDVSIGSDKPGSPYRLFVKFDSKGATLSELQLTDPRYFDLEKPKQQLSLIKLDPKLSVTPLETDVPAIDAKLKAFKTKLNDVNWEVVKSELTEASVSWRYVSPDDSLEVRKKFSVEKADPQRADLEYKAYVLKYELRLTNLSDKKKTIDYEMYGPVGLPIENRYYTQRTRDVAVGFLAPNGGLTPKVITPDTLRSNEENNRVEDWKTPLKYVGTDVQYFAALLIPGEDQLKSNYFSNARAIFVDDAPKDVKGNTKYRTTTLQLKSNELELAPQGKEDSSVKQEFQLFAGPKRPELLRPLGAEKIIDYGISGRLGVPQLLLTVLQVFHQGLSFLPWPYGWAIILLTVLVRSCMFPLSRKQALAAAKMQELQPELTALKEKYKNAPEKFARAQMDLFNKHKCNPLGGCLTAFIQLPIFFGLYQAFSISVAMRGAPFLWINNLAAPDALFQFPMVMPLFGPSFNLLPILTVCLFLAQQKLLMPPATTPEMEMQHKMFFYMTIFMGYMFYSVAAGMCVYFIASSLWGLAERKLLPKNKTTPPGGTIVVQANKPK